MAAGRAGSELGRFLAEQQLKASEERYALAVRGTSDGIWDWNVLTERRCFPPVGKPCWGLLRMNCRISRLHSSIGCIRMTWRACGPRPRTISNVGCPLTCNAGCVTRMEVIDGFNRVRRRCGMNRPSLSHGRATTDITERKQAEEDARRWQQVFEQAEFGLAHADLVSETFLAVNRAFARQCGYTVEELIGRPVLSVYAPEARGGSGALHAHRPGGHLLRVRSTAQGRLGVSGLGRGHAHQGCAGTAHLRVAM